MLEYLLELLKSLAHSQQRQVTFPELLALIGGALPEVLGYLKRSHATPADVRRVFAPLETAHTLPPVAVAFPEHLAAEILSDVTRVANRLGDWAIGQFGAVTDDQIEEMAETFRHALSGNMLTGAVRSYADNPEALAIDILGYLKTGQQPTNTKAQMVC